MDLGVRVWHDMPLLMCRELQSIIDGYAVTGLLSLIIKCRHRGVTRSICVKGQQMEILPMERDI